MNTFLPYPDFRESAACLDRARLGKQRSETLQLLKALLGYTTGWRNHPAARMWRGFEAALCVYGITMCEEWSDRGYRDNTALQITVLGALHELYDATKMPSWFGGPIHASHRSNLLRKDPVHYGKFGWSEPPTLPYVWPR